MGTRAWAVAVVCGAIATVGLAVPANAAGAPMHLILTTAAPGVAAALPLDGTVTGVTVDWGDGTTTGPYDSPVSAQHVYGAAGAHAVSIAGTALGHFGSAGAPGLAYTSDLVTAVTSFGSIGITDLSSAFDGAVSLRAVPAVLPVGVTDLSYAFRGARYFDGPLAGWDTSHVTSMRGMFAGAEVFDHPIGAWDTSSVTDLSSMFAAVSGPAPVVRRSVFSQPIGAWDVSHVTDFSSMFEGNRVFNQPLDGWVTTQSPDMPRMFKGATSFDQSLGWIDLHAPADLREMFDGDTALSVPHLSDLLDIDTVNAMSPVNFRGFGANGSYVYQDNLYAVDNYEFATGTVIALAPDGQAAEAPAAVQPVVVSGTVRVGGTVRSTNEDLFTGRPAPKSAYRWQSSPDGESRWVDVPGGTTSTLTVPESLGGRYLRVVATGANTVAPDLPVVSENVLGPVAAIAPTAPRGLTGGAGDRRVSVRWANPLRTGGSPIASATVRAVPAGGGPVRVCTTTTSFCRVTGLTNGTRYVLTVRATNSAGLRGPASAPLSLTPRTYPGLVRSLTTEYMTGSRVRLQWQAPRSNGGAPVTGYQVRWRYANSSQWTGWTTVARTWAIWPGWPRGWVAEAQVRAVNAAGAGYAVSVRFA